MECRQTPRSPTVEKWSLSIEQRLSNTMAFSIAYVGSFGYHQIVAEDDNSIVPEICATSCTAGGNGKTTSTVGPGTTYIPVGGRPQSGSVGRIFLEHRRQQQL